MDDEVVVLDIAVRIVQIPGDDGRDLQPSGAVEAQRRGGGAVFGIGAAQAGDPAGVGVHRHIQRLDLAHAVIGRGIASVEARTVYLVLLFRGERRQHANKWEVRVALFYLVGYLQRFLEVPAGIDEQQVCIEPSTVGELGQDRIFHGHGHRKAAGSVLGGPFGNGFR